MNAKTVIVNELNRLVSIDFRSGFEHTMHDEVIKALHKFDPAVAMKFNNYILTGRFKSAIDEILDRDETVIELYKQVEAMSNGPGSFEMPEWGTRGT